ncbi:MAG TPA: hypothetical protein ENN19_09975 [Chloroflexi bacterium]|nr:hypothetical protein [Chloroflexota bacterium]
MSLIFHLDFDPYNAEHRKAAEWLSDQPNPTEAIVRLLKAAREGEKRLAQWEALASRLAEEIGRVSGNLSVAPAKRPAQIQIEEDPESARRLDNMFK